MASLIDFFGLLTVLLHGAGITAQSLALGALTFLIALAWPLAPDLGPDAALIERRGRRVLGVAALSLAAITALRAGLGAALLADTVHLSWTNVLGAQFVQADAVAVIAAFALFVLARRPFPPRATRLAMVVLGLTAMAGIVATSHAAARLDNRVAMGLASFLHQLGGAIWLGGLPCFWFALERTEGRRAVALVGRRYSILSMTGVGMILLGALALVAVYIGEVEAVYGTAYGAMVAAKTTMFLGLLALGFGNYRLVERLRANPAIPAVRLRRFAEVEMGVGVAIFFAAASITSLPPAVDLTEDRVTLDEMVERLTPHAPRLVSPDQKSLAIPALQQQLDREWAQTQEKAQTRPQAFVPGAGDLPPRNAEDIAWSEYNHHWAGLFVILIGLAALAERTGRVPIARHWPLLFLILAAFLFFRSDPEAWPMGEIGLLDSFKDPEIVQHRFFVVLIVAFAWFEWRVRLGLFTNAWAPLVFPIMTAVGGAALLTHSHAIANIKDQLLIEITHLPLAIFGIAAGWARWLEIRLPGRGGRVAGWAWPVFFILVGLVLVTYREA